MKIITVLFLVIFFTSCKDEKMVKKLDVEVSAREKEIKKMVSFGESIPKGADLIMGFVIPTSNHQWFIKIAGKLSEFKQIQGAIDKIRGSIEFDDYSVEVIKYEVEKGWKINKEKGYIHSTIVHPDFLTQITILRAKNNPATGRKESLLDVINGWNRQLGNAPMGIEALARLSQRQNVNGQFGLLCLLVKSDRKAPTVQPTQASKSIRVAFTVTEGQTWFLKITGPDDVVNAEKNNFESFVKSFKISAGKAVWEAPQSWKKGQSGGMIYASYQTNGANVTVVPLGAQAGDLTSNVNRWRRQVGLAAATPDEIKKSAVILNAGDLKFNYFYLGKSKPVAPVEKVQEKTTSPKMPALLVAFAVIGESTWYIKLGGDDADIKAQKDNFESFVKSFKVDGKGEPVFKVPESWKRTKNGMMSVASFSAGNTKLNIIPLGAQSGSLEANVNRWRRQVKLPSVTEAEIKKNLSVLKAGSVEFNYVHLSKSVEEEKK